MQPRRLILNPGLLAGMALSVLLHGWLLHTGVMNAQAFHSPAKIQIDSGVVSIELTLMPSIAAIATPEPTEPEPSELEIEFEKEIIPEPKTILPIPLAAEPSNIQPFEKSPPVKTESKTVEPEQPPSIDSIEQAGAIEDDKGALTEATSQSSVSPFYPQFSRRRGEEGVVMLALKISANGKVTNIYIEQSSGHKRLDKAAIKAVNKARFTPATRFGKPCESTLVQTFTFRLN